MRAPRLLFARSLGLVTVPAILLVAVAIADPSTEKVSVLRKEVDDAEATYRSTIGSERQREAWDTLRQTLDRDVPQILELIRHEPTSDTASETLTWIVTNPRNSSRPCKTERGGTLLHTMGGGQSEVFGTFSYTITAGKLAPMFITDDASVFAFFSEVCYTGDPFALLIRETRKGVTKQVERGDGTVAPYIGVPAAKSEPSAEPGAAAEGRGMQALSGAQRQQPPPLLSVSVRQRGRLAQNPNHNLWQPQSNTATPT